MPGSIWRALFAYYEAVLAGKICRDHFLGIVLLLLELESLAGWVSLI
jgi:hypothetical protein